MHSLRALLHVDVVVLTDELNVLIAINEKVKSITTLLHVFCTKINYNDSIQFVKICIYNSQHSTVISSEWLQSLYSEEGQVSQ